MGFKQNAGDHLCGTDTTVGNQKSSQAVTGPVGVSKTKANPNTCFARGLVPTIG